MKPCYRSGLLAAALLSVFPATVTAEQSAIVVTATRLPTPRDEVGSTITVITAEEIERRQYRSVVDALRAVPNLSVIPSGGGIGKLSVVFARGTESNHTLFLLDGIELNDPAGTDGAVDLSHIYIDDVERIEILNGPQGTLYGSDALGAVIQVFTRRGSGDTAVRGRVELGSFDTFTQSAGASGASGGLSWSFNGQHIVSAGTSALGEAFRQSDGTLDDDRHENATLSTRLVYDFNEATSIDFSGRYTGTENDLDLNNSFASDDSDSHGRADQVLLGINARTALFDSLTEHRAGFSYSSIKRGDDDAADPFSSDTSHQSNHGSKRKFELQNDFYGIEHHILTLGYEKEIDRVDSELTSTSLFGFFDSSVNEEVNTWSVYLQDQFSYGNFSGTLGARRDKHELAGGENTWRVALSQQFPDSGTRLRGSYATAFKAPTVNQLFVNSPSSFGLFTGNPDLKPETSRGWEVGVDQGFRDDSASAGLTYYRQRIRNLINFNSSFTSNENRDRVDIHGVEGYLKGTLTKTLSASLGASYNSSKDAVSGARLRRRPTRKANLALDYQPSRAAQVTVQTVYVGPRSDTDAVTGQAIPRGGYTLVNLAASHTVTPALTVHARIDNLTDKQYEEPHGFMQPGIGIYFGFTVRN